MESAAITTRGVKGIERKGKGRIWGAILVVRCRGGGRNQTVHHSLSAAARGSGNAARQRRRFFRASVEKKGGSVLTVYSGKCGKISYGNSTLLSLTLPVPLRILEPVLRKMARPQTW